MHACIHREPAALTTSSDQLVGGRSTLRFPIRGLFFRTFQPQQLSVLRAIWPAHSHFIDLIRLAMSLTLFLLRVSLFMIRSRRESLSAVFTFNIDNQYFPFQEFEGVFHSGRKQFRKYDVLSYTSF